MAKKSAFTDQFGETELPRLSEKKVRPKPKREKAGVLYGGGKNKERVQRKRETKSTLY